MLAGPAEADVGALTALRCNRMGRLVLAGTSSNLFTDGVPSDCTDDCVAKAWTVREIRPERKPPVVGGCCSVPPGSPLGLNDSPFQQPGAVSSSALHPRPSPGATLI